MQIDAAERAATSAAIRRATEPGSPIGSIPPRTERRDRIAILAHGSSAQSTEMHAIAIALAAQRGHGGRGRHSRPRRLGDARRRRLSRPARRRSCRSDRRTPQVRPGRQTLADRPFGRAAGSRCASRADRSAIAFDRFVLLSPYLGYSAPTNRPAEGRGLLGVARPAAHHRDHPPWPARDRLAAVVAGHRLRQRSGSENGRDLQVLRSACCRTIPPRPTGRALSSGSRAASPSSPAPTTN